MDNLQENGTQLAVAGAWQQVSAVPERFRSVSALEPGQSVLPLPMRTVSDPVPVPRRSSGSSWTAASGSLSR